jgi:two-component system, NarL family, sensor kinase
MALARLVGRTGVVRSGGAVGGPMLWFAGASLLAVIALGFTATAILRRQARGEAIRDAKEITRLAGEGIAEPALNARLLAGDRAAQSSFDHAMRTRVLKDPVVRIKLWTLDGRIVYSDERPLVGRRFALEPEVMSAVRKRVVAADVSDLSRPENRYERRFGKLLEVYLPIEAPGGRRLLFEDYVRYGAISASQERLFSRFAPALGAALLLLWLVQLPLAWSLSQRLRQRQREREALLERAIDSSATERRRIAQHLHDGVVQDLAGVSYALAAAADRLERAGPRPLAEVVRDAAASTRRALRELRGLLIGIYPPSLQRSGLEAAVSDLLAPLSARGIAVEAEIGDDLALAPETEELIFRSAQEALRKVAKHADPSRVAVSVSRSNGSVVLAVSDDGRGFDPAARAADSPSLGLRMLEDLVEEHQGRLEVHSDAGRGTVVTVELAAR